MKKQLFIDVVGSVGIGLASYGAWLIYSPAGFILTGVALVVWATAASLK